MPARSSLFIVRGDYSGDYTVCAVTQGSADSSSRSTLTGTVVMCARISVDSLLRVARERSFINVDFDCFAIKTPLACNTLVLTERGTNQMIRCIINEETICIIG